MKIIKTIKNLTVIMLFLAAFSPSWAMDAAQSADGFVVQKVTGEDSKGAYELTYATPRNIKIEKLLGRGAYGCVAQATMAGEPVAVKKSIPERDEFNEFRNEAVVLCLVEHPNIVTILGVHIISPPTGLELYLITELMATDLHRVMRSIGIDQPFCAMRSRDIIFQIISGVAYLHAEGIVHRDLKPANVLINADCTTKIADLGSAALAHPGLENKIVATRWYRAPEGVAKSHISELESPEALDQWSLGCIAAEVVSWQANHQLFPGADLLDMQKRLKLFFSQEQRRCSSYDHSSLAILERLFLEPSPKGASTRENLSEFIGKAYESKDPEGFAHLLTMINSLLSLNPADRISAAECLKNPCFKEFETVRVAPKLPEIKKCDLRTLLRKKVCCEPEFVRMINLAWTIRDEANQSGF